MTRETIIGSESLTEVDAPRYDLRRDVLREVFDALSPDSPWAEDDRFEHYPLNVQVKITQTLLETRSLCATGHCSVDRRAMRREDKAERT